MTFLGKALPLLLALAVLPQAFPQKQHQEIRRLGEITAIVNQTDEELILTDRGIAGTLIAQGSKEATKELVSEIEGTILTLTRKPSKNHLPKLPFFNASLTVSDPLRIVISCHSLASLKTTGTGSTALVSQRFKNLKVESEGEGAVHFSNCRFYSLEAKLQGSGNLVFEKCETVDARLQLEGKGELFAHGLRCKNVKALLHGKGTLTTWPSQFLDAKVIGPGKLLYRDNPPTLKEQTQDGGTIDRYFPTDSLHNGTKE
jgi:hypothetical protein